MSTRTQNNRLVARTRRPGRRTLPEQHDKLTVTVEDKSFSFDPSRKKIKAGKPVTFRTERPDYPVVELPRYDHDNKTGCFVWASVRVPPGPHGVQVDVDSRARGGSYTISTTPFPPRKGPDDPEPVKGTLEVVK